MRRGEPHPLQAVDLAAGPEQLAEGQPVAEPDAVGVDVLAEQGDLQHAVRGERLGSRRARRRAGGPPPCRAGSARCRTCRCCCSRPRWRPRPSTADSRRAGSTEGKRSSDSRISTWAGSCDPGALEQHGQRADVVGAEHDVDPRRPLGDRRAVLLRQAAADCDLHAGVRGLHRQQVAEVAVEPVVGVLPDRAGVEDDDVRVGAVGRPLVPGRPPAGRPAARSRACSSGTRRCGSRNFAAVVAPAMHTRLDALAGRAADRQLSGPTASSGAENERVSGFAASRARPVGHHMRMTDSGIETVTVAETTAEQETAEGYASCGPVRRMALAHHRGRDRPRRSRPEPSR